MRTLIALLRGVNIGGHHKIKMEELRKLFAAMKLRDAQTYVQSGNVVFRAEGRDTAGIERKIRAGIAKKFGFEVSVMVRTAEELREVVRRNPFAKRKEIEPTKFAVMFLGDDPGEEKRKLARQIDTKPEELVLRGREAYIYFPNGMARPKMSWPKIERVLGTSGTGRNWNSVMKLLELAEKAEGGGGT
jgi:uncharacterized protein (DUF1697 family)